MAIINGRRIKIPDPDEYRRDVSDHAEEQECFVVGGIRLPIADRQTRQITIRIPEDMLDDLKGVACMKGMGYQNLMKAYISQCLRQDLATLWKHKKAEQLESTLDEMGLQPDQKARILDLVRN